MRLVLSSFFLWVFCRINRAKARRIPQQRTSGLKAHRSVKMRMEAEYEDERRREKGKRYVPKPNIRVNPTWVD
jgi:predicted SprT family Zn-dependent metalloprotease